MNAPRPAAMSRIDQWGRMASAHMGPAIPAKIPIWSALLARKSNTDMRKIVAGHAFQE